VVSGSSPCWFCRSSVKMLPRVEEKRSSGVGMWETGWRRVINEGRRSGMAGAMDEVVYVSL
jgi:hypothetical protein